MRYWVRVKVKTKNRCWFGPSQDQELLFVPLSPVPFPPILGVTEVIRVGQFSSLKVVLPTLNILFTQEPLMLRLFLQPQAGLDATLYPITVQQIGFTIKSTTTLNLCHQPISWTSTTDIMRLSGINYTLPPGVNYLEINPELWRGALLPDVVSSFTTCTIYRQYALSITVSFSYGQKQLIGVCYIAQ